MEQHAPYTPVKRPDEGFSAGIEQEFQLFARGRKVDFRSLFPTVSRSLGSVRFRNRELAAVVDAGYMLACDAGEAEIATAPIRLHGAGPIELAQELARCRESMLDAVLAQGIDEVRGYSTHLNIGLSHGGEVALACSVAELVGPALTLLMEGRRSPGLLVRPRPLRLEIGTEYVDDDATLVAGIVIITGALSALERDGAALDAWPRARLRHWELGRLRGGIFVPHHAFGEPVDLRLRAARISLVNGEATTAGDLLDQNVELAIAELGATLDPRCADIARDAASANGSPQRRRRDVSHIERRAAPATSRDGRLLAGLAASRHSTSPALFVDWHGAVFSVPGTGGLVAGVPWQEIPRFLDSARDGTLTTLVSALPVGGLLSHLGQLSTMGLFSDFDPAELGRQAYFDFGRTKGKKKDRRRVAVIGAGFAGLMTAWLLNNDVDVTVFEASERIGGRVETSYDFIAGKTVEAGAELIGTNHPTWWQLAKLFDLTLVPVSTEKDYERQHLKVQLRLGSTDYTEAEQEQIERDLEPIYEIIGTEARRISSTEPWSSRNAAYYDSFSVADRLSMQDMFGPTSPVARKCLELTLGNDQCTPVSKQSYLGLLTAVSAHRVGDDMNGYWESTETHRCYRGNEQLAQRLAASLPDVRRSTPVFELVVQNDGVFVGSGPTPDYEHFDYVVLASPPGNWPNVTSSPAFVPSAYTMASGPAVKFLTRFATAFWKGQGLAPSALWDQLGAVWESTDKQPEGAGGFGLSVFSGGDYVLDTATKYSNGLNVIFPGYRTAVTGIRFEEWQHRAWIGTGYSAPAPGQVCTVGKALATPFLGRLFFAGEQASPGFFGFMEGALQSGIRAADQVVEAIASTPSDSVR